VTILTAKTIHQQLMLPAGGGRLLQPDRLRFFTYRKLKYFWHPQNHCFATISQLEADVNKFYHFFVIKFLLSCLLNISMIASVPRPDLLTKQFIKGY
jgi:hypothetical protein